MNNVELLRTLGRMCNEHIACDNCSLYDGDAGCTESFDRKSKEAVEIIEKWYAEHPQKTYAMDYFEKFPNAERRKFDGIEIPKADFQEAHGYSLYGELDMSSQDCWTQIVEEKV